MLDYNKHTLPTRSAAGPMSRFANPRASVQQIRSNEFGFPEQAMEWARGADITELFPSRTKTLIKELEAAYSTAPELVAAFVLGSSAITAQALFDVQRPDRPLCPCSLNVIGVAGSGQRKTTLLNELLSEPRFFQQVEHRDNQLAVSQQVAQRAWELQCQAREAAIKKNYANPAELAEHVAGLEALHLEKPQGHRHGKSFLMTNLTWPALVKKLHEGSPSVGITNDEAGGFLSQLPHMMSELHAASDGSDIRHDRASTPSAFVEQPRISLVLAVQPRFWIRFLAGHEMDYAETGLGPRTLLVVIRDRRTQYRAEQPSRDARDDYRATIKRLLSSYAAKLQAADLSREILTFTPDAQKQFKATEKWLNEEAQSGGVFATIRPYANRCAETIARIAAVLHVIEGRVESAIQLDTLLHAIAIGRWFALHYLDLFEHTGIPQIERDAQAILKVLQRRAVSYGPEWMPKSTLRQYLPTSDDLRSDLGRVEEALNFLLRRNVIMTATGTRADRFILNTTSPHMAG